MVGVPLVGVDMTPLQLTLLGGFQARIGSGPALSLPTRKAQALLAYLALPAGRAHPRDKLATLLWGDSAEGPARNSLRQALFALRRVLPAGGVRVEGDVIALDPAAVDVDVAAFERGVAEGTPAALAAAAQLYQGDLLAGLSVEGAAGFEEWLLGERERLRELALEGLAKLLAQQRAAGAAEAAIQTGLHLLGLDPLQEPVHRALMRLYAAAGRRGRALRQYQACVAVLAAGAGGRAGSGDPAALPGDPPPAAGEPPGAEPPGPRASGRRLGARRAGRPRYAPRGAGCGSRAPASAPRRGDRRTGPARRRAGGGGHRQDPSRRRSSAVTPRARRARPARAVLRERADPGVRALGRRVAGGRTRGHHRARQRAGTRCGGRSWLACSPSSGSRRPTRRRTTGGCSRRSAS